MRNNLQYTCIKFGEVFIYTRLEHLQDSWEPVNPVHDVYGIPTSEPCSYFEKSPNDFVHFRIKENNKYIFRFPENKKIGSLDLPKNKGIEVVLIGGQFVSLSVSGFLGIMKFKIENIEFILEVVSSKIGYDNDFVIMTKEIANDCSQLLQSWSAPTYLNYESDNTKYSQTLLEQFIFVKHLIGNENLTSYIGAIKKSPHQSLALEQKWMPSAYADSTNFMFQPFKYGRDWKIGDKIPQEILSTKKYITYDTPPNKFVKYALNYFRQLCEDIIVAFSKVKNNNYLVAKSEVSDTLTTIQNLLSDDFFRHISPVHQIPIGNQTLQKKFGYREILHGWLLSQMALQINWPGREDCLNADTRNVAKLYEYWLYFKLLKIIENIAGAPENTGNKGESILFNDKGLKINLKEGKASFLKFKYTNNEEPVCIYFYFNKSFKSRERVKSPGSYSKIFRPDYTLVIIPETYATKDKNPLRAEINASNDGKIAYLHFDAKYRLDLYNQFFVEGSLKEQIEFEESEKEEKQKDKYKRGDLYKMHTYKDAIRRTTGSYVLYPGVDSSKPFNNYHEILPGVGAFAIRPDDTCNCNMLQDFIRECLQIQQSKFSQLYRLQHDIHDIVREPSVFYNKEKDRISPPPGKPVFLPDGESLPPDEFDVMIGYVRSNEHLEEIKKNYLFWWHAVDEQNNIIDCDVLKLSQSRYLVFSGKVQTNLIGKIESIQLEKKEKLPFPKQRTVKMYYKVIISKWFDSPDIFKSREKFDKGKHKVPFHKKWSELFF